MKNTIIPTLSRSLSLVSAFAFFFSLNVAKVSAQTIDADSWSPGDSIGNIDSLSEIFFFIFNLLKYLGWAGVIIGVGLAIFGLIYKLINEDNQKVMETVQSYITKAVVIVIAGIILISAGFIIEVVADLFGLRGTVTTDLNQGTTGDGGSPIEE